jgi:N-acetylglucosaminyldiphosphoundecaprenol N-acetyl-beta-D-mannosaminyltransferase
MGLRKSIIGLNIDTGSYSFFIDKILFFSSNSISSYVCFANVHMTIEAFWNPSFSEIVNNAELVTPDGVPLIKAMSFLYGYKQERVAGMDVLPDMLYNAEKNNLSVFFYGGTQEMLTMTKAFIESKYPKLKHHYYSPPFRPLTVEEENTIVELINNSNTNLLVVALGCPKQEKWMAKMKGKINACMIGVGGALPVLIGMQKRAPKWMRQASLEWLFRLVQEPKRLFRRYFVTNFYFIYLIIVQFIKSRSRNF